MDSVFPFGLPWPTVLYLWLYMLTLVIHVFFMNYVLAGSAYLVSLSVIDRRGADGKPTLVAVTLREWLPFMLSAAITAGIAPLLFVQILYEKSFYTANLLLFNRWMAILPVLIIAFYLLYVWKAKRVQSWPRFATIPLGLFTFGCFAFVAWSWTENHLLSVNPDVWVEQYTSGDWLYRSGELLPRLAVWFVGCFPTLALILSWQLWYLQRDRDASEVEGCQHVSNLALGGLILAAVAVIVYVFCVPGTIRQAVIGNAGLVYLFMAGSGWGVQFASWIQMKRAGTFEKIWLITASIGLTLTLLGTAVIREIVRWTRLDSEELFAAHERAAGVGGLTVFLLFFAINATLCGYCVIRVKRGWLPETE